MLIRYKALGGQLEVEFDATGEKDLFTKLGPIQELIDQCKCGKCKSTHVRFNHRVHGEYDFYELKCADCGAALGFGQRKDGSGLFPKRKDTDGNLLPDGGWSIYVPGSSSQSSSDPVEWGRGGQGTRNQPATVPPNDDNAPVSEDDIPF